MRTSYWVPQFTFPTHSLFLPYQLENANESYRNDALGELLEDMVQNSGEHGLNAVDILVSFMNNRMLQCERDDIAEMMSKEE